MFLNEETIFFRHNQLPSAWLQLRQVSECVWLRVGEGHFPYEYMDGIGKLENCALPPQEAFYSRLKNKHISDADYARCHAVWCDNRMKTMRDVLVWYNNRDVVPFLDAIDKQFAFYKQQNIDMFKDGVSVPGLTLLYLLNELHSNTFFAVFNQTNSDLHLLVKDNIVGGPAIIFHRYHEKDITKILGEETCRSIVGYDANALYIYVGADAGHPYGLVHTS